MNLCVDCKFYQAGTHVDTDMCLHPDSFTKNEHSGIREELTESVYSCRYMRASRCENGKLFEAKP